MAGMHRDQPTYLRLCVMFNVKPILGCLVFIWQQVGRRLL